MGNLLVSSLYCLIPILSHCFTFSTLHCLVPAMLTTHISPVYEDQLRLLLAHPYQLDVITTTTPSLHIPRALAIFQAATTTPCIQTGIFVISPPRILLQTAYPPPESPSIIRVNFSSRTRSASTKLTMTCPRPTSDISWILCVRLFDCSTTFMRRLRFWLSA
jgi:hypothetical protein